MYAFTCMHLHACKDQGITKWARSGNDTRAKMASLLVAHVGAPYQTHNWDFLMLSHNLIMQPTRFKFPKRTVMLTPATNAVSKKCVSSTES